MKVCLQSDADVRVRGPHAAIQFERPLRVLAPLHVDPEVALGLGGRPSQAVEVGVSRGRIDVEAELSGLDGDLRLQAGRGCEDLLVVGDHALCVF